MPAAHRAPCRYRGNGHASHTLRGRRHGGPVSPAIPEAAPAAPGWRLCRRSRLGIRGAGRLSRPAFEQASVFPRQDTVRSIDMPIGPSAAFAAAGRVRFIRVFALLAHPRFCNVSRGRCMNQRALLKVHAWPGLIPAAHLADLIFRSLIVPNPYPRAVSRYVSIRKVDTAGARKRSAVAGNPGAATAVEHFPALPIFLPAFHSCRTKALSA